MGAVPHFRVALVERLGTLTTSASAVPCRRQAMRAGRVKPHAHAKTLVRLPRTDTQDGRPGEKGRGGSIDICCMRI